MTLYELILGLPLFQGLSNSDLSNIVAQTKFEFRKAEEGTVYIKEGAPCTSITFLLKGLSVIHSHANDYSYSVSETVSAPQMFGLYHLFGLSQYFPGDVEAASPCSLLMLTKEDVMRLCDEYFVFRINLMNRFSKAIQRLDRYRWAKEPTEISNSIVSFFSLHSYYPAGHKVFNITMQQLANEVHQSRLNVSRQLNSWEEASLVRLSRGRIDIPHLERLIQLKDNP